MLRENILGGEPVQSEDINFSQTTMHDDMEDGINPSKRRRGRPAKKKIKLEPTEADEKENPTIIDVDLNQGFDMVDAKEPEER